MYRYVLQLQFNYRDTYVLSRARYHRICIYILWFSLCGILGPCTVYNDSYQKYRKNISSCKSDYVKCELCLAGIHHPFQTPERTLEGGRYLQM